MANTIQLIVARCQYEIARHGFEPLCTPSANSHHYTALEHALWSIILTRGVATVCSEQHFKNFLSFFFFLNNDCNHELQLCFCTQINIRYNYTGDLGLRHVHQSIIEPCLITPPGFRASPLTVCCFRFLFPVKSDSALASGISISAVIQMQIYLCGRHVIMLFHASISQSVHNIIVPVALKDS